MSSIAFVLFIQDSMFHLVVKTLYSLNFLPFVFLYINCTKLIVHDDIFLPAYNVL
jgi:hypothetical protein